MSQLKEKTVFMVLYNYSDCDYSIIKIMANLDDAYKYICYQEIEWQHNYIEDYKLIEVSNYNDIKQKCYVDCINICYIPYDKYCNISLCEGYREEVCHYAIVPMVIN